MNENNFVKENVFVNGSYVENSQFTEDSMVQPLFQAKRVKEGVNYIKRIVQEAKC